MITLNNPRLYLKGTCNVNIADPTTGNIDLQNNKIKTNQLTATVNLEAIKAGLGNAPAIMLASDADVSLNLVAADFSMAARALQVGASVTYNAVAPACVSITASSSTLTIPSTITPVAPVGFANVICYVTYTGSTTGSTAYTVNSSTKAIEGFTATEGTVYTVWYFAASASNSQVRIGGRFAPAIKHVTAQMAVYSTEGTSSANQGTQVGWLYYVIPRMQFAGTPDTDGSQENAATTVLSGKAIVYEDTTTASCTDCNGGALAYYIYVPFEGATANVESLAVPGGTVSVAAAGTQQIPVKYIMDDGTVVQPNYNDFTYVLATGGSTYCSVGSSGVITGIAEGDTEVTITSTLNTSLSTVCNISISA